VQACGIKPLINARVRVPVGAGAGQGLPVKKPAFNLP
jgi:hypothetical protein